MTNKRSEMIVPILMGSGRDLEFAQKIAAKLASLGIPYELRVASAHKATSFALGVVEAYEAEGRPKVYITIAGRSNALSAVVDANASSPVIACPPYAEAFGGADIYSSLRMPSGVTPAVILDPEGAAILAAKILSLYDPSLRAQVAALQAKQRQQVMDEDEELRR